MHVKFWVAQMTARLISQYIMYEAAIKYFGISVKHGIVCSLLLGDETETLLRQSTCSKTLKKSCLIPVVLQVLDRESASSYP